MAVPIVYSDTIIAAMNITNGLVDKMKLETRISAEQVGYWTELNRLYDATTNIPAELMNKCMQSLMEWTSKVFKKPVAYDDVIVAAMNISNGVVDKMKLETRISAVQVGYWTELNRIYDANGDASGCIPVRIWMDCMGSLKEFISKMMV